MTSPATARRNCTLLPQCPFSSTSPCMSFWAHFLFNTPESSDWNRCLTVLLYLANKCRVPLYSPILTQAVNLFGENVNYVRMENIFQMNNWYGKLFSDSRAAIHYRLTQIIWSFEWKYIIFGQNFKWTGKLSVTDSGLCINKLYSSPVLQSGMTAVTFIVSGNTMMTGRLQIQRWHLNTVNSPVDQFHSGIVNGKSCLITIPTCRDVFSLQIQHPWIEWYRENKQTRLWILSKM